MTFIKIAVISSVVSTLLLYFAGAFVAWDFNPGEWSVENRGMLVIMWPVFTAILAAIIEGCKTK